MSNRHAHVSTSSADCDGPMDRHYVIEQNDDERAESGQVYNDFSEINFRERVLGSIVSLTTLVDGMEGTVRIHEHGFDWSRPTDEGYESAEVIWCEDDCDLGERGQRDYFAEAAGY